MKTISKRLLVVLFCVVLLVGSVPAALAYGSNAPGRDNGIAVHNENTAIVDPNGTLWVNKTTSLSSADGPYKLMENVRSVSQGAVSAAVKTDGTLWLWGLDWGSLLGARNELGPTERDDPFLFFTGVKSVSVGDYAAAAIKEDGSLWMWGAGGRLFSEYDKDYFTPIQVMDNVAAVAMGDDTVAVIKTDGTLWTWGNNYEGQLGRGTVSEVGINTEDSTPRKLMDGVAMVSLGDEVGAAIKQDGSLWTWGVNHFGQLGDGTTIDRSAPVKIMDDVAVVSIGNIFSAAAKKDGTLWLWGRNSHGCIGDGLPVKTTVEDLRLSPVQVLDGVADVAVSESHTVAMKKDGSYWVWGTNTEGQLMDKTIYNYTTTLSKENGTRSTLYYQLVPHELSALRTQDKPSAWAAEEIERARAAGMVPDLTGTPNFTAAITRLQFAELVINMVEKAAEKTDAPAANITVTGLKETAISAEYIAGMAEEATGKAIIAAPDTTFTDCKEAAVLKAYAAGIVSGVGNGKFAPDQTTNREQIAAMVYRAITYIEKETGKEFTTKNTDLTKFTDKSSVSTWAAEGVGVLANNGIMKGTSDTALSPSNTCSVEQSILLVYRVFNLAK